ncbi:aminoacyl-tRNA hydrolase [Crocinitomicaceae bacterium]|jgi:PTH1 family peptidyl-tRNA hydrolase|nr:aminoacyl-tRNA hydrolase [Crocinitomicaceae bacterium]MDG2153231.1 aminoacyl-tRNA hydrolase [Crocinitomicaceae bacterium]
MKYLIVGLGNPGAQYDNTRHNIGFDVLNKLAKDSEVSFKVDRLCEKAEVKYKGRTIILIKPTTFMNLSGKAVHYWLQKEKIPVERLLVISDDLALPFGKLRLKPKGSDGGHNGLKDIQSVLQTPLYSRLRFGVGSEFARGRQSDFVLGRWSDDEFRQLEQRVELCVEFIKSFTTIGVSMTMSALNGK